MAGLKFGSFSQAARVSTLDIDMDLDMGVLGVIAANGQFTKANLGKTVVTDTLILPYTVTPSENVYFTSDITAKWFKTNFEPISGSIVIGPTSVPISPRLYIDVETNSTTILVTLRVHKNGEVIATIEGINKNYPEDGTIAIDLPELVAGDVLTFSARATIETQGTKLSNFRLAGDVVIHVIDGPSAETVYD